VNRAEQIHEVLARLVRETPGVEHASVLSGDGLSISAYPGASDDDDRVAALVASFFRMGEHTCGELGRGATRQLQMQGEDGWLLLVPVAPDTILQARARRQAKLGALMMSLRLAAAELRGLF